MQVLIGLATVKWVVVEHVEQFLKKVKVKELADFAYTLDGDMLKEGYILACQSSLKSDITIELDKSQKAVEATKM
jgi:Na+-transporting NADH:ubiquinone oxidoreductase subunit NqrF